MSVFELSGWLVLSFELGYGLPALLEKAVSPYIFCISMVLQMQVAFVACVTKCRSLQKFWWHYSGEKT